MRTIQPTRVLAMFEEYVKGATLEEIALKFGVTKQTVFNYRKKDEWDKKLYSAKRDVVEYSQALNASLITQFLEKMRQDTEKLDGLIERAFRYIMENKSQHFSLKDIDLLIKLKLLVIGTVTEGLAGPKVLAQNNITINNNQPNQEFDSKLNSEERTQLYKIFNEARGKEKTTEDFVAEFQQNFPLDGAKQHGTET